ncbi:MAG: DUF975 family protein [Acholeplasmataceae bacterium]
MTRNVKPQHFEAMIAVLIVSLVVGALSSIGIGFIIAGPLYVGLIYYFKKLQVQERTEFNIIFDGFKDPLTPSIVGYVLVLVFTFLWSLLFLIPGIIKSFSYAMTLYIIAENPTITATEAITRSREIMVGNKFRLFILYLSFIGWAILGIFTFGLAIIYIMPVIQASVLEFYNDVKTNTIN